MLGLSHVGHLGLSAIRDTPATAPSDGTSAEATATTDPAVQKILEVVARIDRTTFDEARTSNKILAAVSGSAPTPAASAKPASSVAQA